MSQDVDVQLKVWKDLAISKQILMGAATDALGLNSECTTAELKTALSEAIKRAREADITIQETRSHAEQQVSEFGQRTETAELARKEAERPCGWQREPRDQWHSGRHYHSTPRTPTLLLQRCLAHVKLCRVHNHDGAA